MVRREGALQAPGSSRAVVALFLLAGAMLSGCASSRAADPQALPTQPVLRVTQQAGGTHYRMLVHEDVWYQTFGSDLLVLEPRSARVLQTVHLGRSGEHGAAIDMLVHDGELFVVLDADEVVVLNIDDARSPRVIDSQSADELTIAPKRLSTVGGELYVSGVGGVVRWSDGERIFRNLGDVSRVVMSDGGLVACVGRRIYQLHDGRFVGSASDLVPADDLRIDTDAELILFTRQSPEGAIVGLMSTDMRELDHRLSSVAVLGQVRSARAFGGRIWVVTDAEVLSYEFMDGRLERSLHVDVLGARDVQQLNENHLALAGSFGRCIYRIESGDRGPGDTFLQVHREPSRLSAAKSDGRHILAGSEEGSWLYLIGSTVAPSDERLDRDQEPSPPPAVATTVGARARISGDGTTVTITTDEGVFEYIEPTGATMHCVTAVDGEFWIGHDLGITVLHSRPSDDDPVAGSLRIDGPVLYLFPLRVGRGTAFVSEFGGFGTAQWVQEPIVQAHFQ